MVNKFYHQLPNDIKNKLGAEPKDYNIRLYKEYSKYSGVEDCIPGHGGCSTYFILKEDAPKLEVTNPMVFKLFLIDKDLRLETYRELTRLEKRNNTMYIVEYNTLDDYYQGDRQDIYIGNLDEVKKFMKKLLEGLVVRGLSKDLELPIISITDSEIHIEVKEYKE